VNNVSQFSMHYCAEIRRIEELKKIFAIVRRFVVRRSFVRSSSFVVAVAVAVAVATPPTDDAHGGTGMLERVGDAVEKIQNECRSLSETARSSLQAKVVMTGVMVCDCARY